MRKKFVFDLDGVMRDLHKYIEKKFDSKITHWGWTNGNGEDVCDVINNDLDILLKAEPTEYLQTILKYYPKPEIWTDQPDHWIYGTLEWINYNVGTDCKVRILDTGKKRERLDSHKDLVLVEDSPNFDDYERIVLIDKRHNKGVNASVRVYNEMELENELKQAQY